MGFFCVMSLETSGPNEGDICAIGMVKIVDGELGDKHVSLVCPPAEKIWNTEVHGLARRDVRDCPSFKNLWPSISKSMEGADAFVAHNAAHVREVLYGACRHGLKAPKAPFSCTAKGGRSVPRASLSRAGRRVRGFRHPPERIRDPGQRESLCRNLPALFAHGHAPEGHGARGAEGEKGALSHGIRPPGANGIFKRNPGVRHAGVRQ